MSYPKITAVEATPAKVKELLDSGKHIFIPMPVGYELPVFKDAETGKYVLDVDATTGELHEFEGTEEGLKHLAFFLAFCGVDYA